MFIRRRTYNQLIARADTYAEGLRDATRGEQNAYRSVARTAYRSGRHAAELTRRLHRALGAVARSAPSAPRSGPGSPRSRRRTTTRWDSTSPRSTRARTGSPDAATSGRSTPSRVWSASD